ncbi:MAG: hypothetical protein OXI37_08075 [Gammaproteobacteria bacterium]|nr:hypothetical protein [Gammaproteobacteria bacterium]
MYPKLLALLTWLRGTYGQEKFDQAIKGILNADPVEDIPPPKRTKKNIKRKFTMRLSRKGKPSIKEVVG